MSQDDPFAAPDSDRTIIVPSPGRRPVPQNATTTAAPPARPLDNTVHAPAQLASGLNPLVAAANPLLDLAPQLHATLQHGDPSGLREYLAENIKAFERRAKAAGIAPEKVIGARYALCTLLDETAASTPWGGSGIWARHSLLVMFHNETWGGEKFFQLLSKLAENPAANRDLLEFLYVCLALGFEGRYRVIENGKAQLETLCERLAGLLHKEQSDYEPDLSVHWQGVAAERTSVFSILPLWVAAAACALLLLGAYTGFSYSLNSQSDPVFAQIQSIRVKAPIFKAEATAPSKPRLAAFLAKEIEAGLVAVSDQDSRSIVTLRGDGLFAAGSATISPAFLPILIRIAEALNSAPGQVVIAGHTDDRPIRSARFPSNWHLSQERARAVLQILSTRVTNAGRLSAEGRADAEPVAPNDTPANRARNRRVDITLYVSPAGN